MRLSVLPVLLALSCGTTLDGGIRAARCGSAEAAGLPICKTEERCNSVNDCIPACAMVGCLEGSCTYRTGSCEAPGCSGKPTAGACVDCVRAGGTAAPLQTCICSACAGTCDCQSPDPKNSDACAACIIAALVHPGVCSSDLVFQDDCSGTSASSCRAQAQAIVACRR